MRASRSIASAGTPTSGATRSGAKAATCAANDPAVLAEHVGDGVEQQQVALRTDAQRLGRRRRRLRRARIDDHDARRARVVQDAPPQDRMRDAQVRADQQDHVGLLEIGVAVGRRVEAEALLVRDDGGGHALARVAVAVQHPHAELREAAEQRQLLARKLAGAEKRRRLGAMPRADRAHAVDERARRRVPVHGHQAPEAAEQRPGRTTRGAERRERFPALGARGALVHRVAARGN
jgi:hypothetical protein